MKETKCILCGEHIAIIAAADGLHITWAEYNADSLIPWAELGVTAVTFAHPEQHGGNETPTEATSKDRILCCVCKRPVTGLVYRCDRCGQECCDWHVGIGLHSDTSCDNCWIGTSATHTSEPPTTREELRYDYPALVAASDVMSVAEAQRLGIGEHAPDVPDIDCQDDYEYFTGTGRYAVKHTSECQATYQRIKADYEAWTAQWPRFCRVCEGYGGTIDMSDEDGGLEQCEACTSHNICPRCGEQGLHGEDADGPCSACGWTWGDQPPYDPFRYECKCDLVESEVAR